MEKFKKFFFYFICCSVFGWLFEVILNFIRLGELKNWGTLFGPWLPIYGWGGLFIILLSQKIKKKPLWIFIFSFLICAVVEFLTSLYLEIMYDAHWWDYSDLPLNIDGRIWLGGLLIFSVFSLFVIYIFVPLLDKIQKKLNKKFFTIMVFVLVILHITDFIYCTINPRTDTLNMGYTITNKLVI